MLGGTESSIFKFFIHFFIHIVCEAFCDNNGTNHFDIIIEIVHYVHCQLYYNK